MTTSQRRVGATITGSVLAPSDIELSVAVAADLPVDDEQLTVTVNDVAMQVREVAAAHATRLHVVSGVQPGDLRVQYTATVTGQGTVPEGDEPDRIVATRPSRYCPTDAMGALARAEFGDLDGADLLRAVTRRVNEALVYDGTQTRNTDTALDTWLRRTGVCRDYTHVATSFMRALGVPTRLASAYAPGLVPMDFHAVIEAWVDGGWHVADATMMAARGSLVRIATGRDAADTAFMTMPRGNVAMGNLQVTASADPVVDFEDPDLLVQLR